MTGDPCKSSETPGTHAVYAPGVPPHPQVADTIGPWPSALRAVFPIVLTSSPGRAAGEESVLALRSVDRPCSADRLSSGLGGHCNSLLGLKLCNPFFLHFSGR